MPSVFIKRGTRAQLNTAAAAGGLNAGELYLVTDESKIAVGVSTTAYADIGGVTDHGGLSGLADDDHPQYHNDARGDDRYLKLTGGALSGDISIAKDGQAGFDLSSYGDSYSAMLFRRYRGSQSAPSAVLSGDLLGGWVGQGYDSSGVLRNGAILYIQAADDFSPSSAPSRVLLQTTPVGSVVPQSRLRIEPDGTILINTGASDGLSKAYVAGDIGVSAGSTYRVNGVDVLTPLQLSAQRLLCPILPISGRYYDQSNIGTAYTTITGAAGRIDLSPICFPTSVAVDRLGVNVTTGVASAVGRVVIYSANAAGQPATRVFYGASDLDLSTTGAKEHTASFTFQSGVLYWIGFHHSSTATISALPANIIPSLGLTAANATSQVTSVRQTVTYASGAPLSFGFVAGHLTAGGTVSSIRFRVA